MYHQQIFLVQHNLRVWIDFWNTLSRSTFFKQSHINALAPIYWSEIQAFYVISMTINDTFIMNIMHFLYGLKHSESKSLLPSSVRIKTHERNREIYSNFLWLRDMLEGGVLNQTAVCPVVSSRNLWQKGKKNLSIQLNRFRIYRELERSYRNRNDCIFFLFLQVLHY